MLFFQQWERSEGRIAEPTDAEIDAVIEEFGGDPREAIRALLSDVATLAADYESAVSRGYVRGRAPAETERKRRTGP